jgi:hypothetical protein
MKKSYLIFILCVVLVGAMIGNILNEQYYMYGGYDLRNNYTVTKVGYNSVLAPPLGITGETNYDYDFLSTLEVGDVIHFDMEHDRWELTSKHGYS